jgi:hypothetical protein
MKKCNSRSHFERPKMHLLATKDAKPESRSANEWRILRSLLNLSFFRIIPGIGSGSPGRDAAKQ